MSSSIEANHLKNSWAVSMRSPTGSSRAICVSLLSTLPAFAKTAAAWLGSATLPWRMFVAVGPFEVAFVTIETVLVLVAVEVAIVAEGLGRLAAAMEIVS